nr:hypothetical protein CFP56_18868 [Quercus suber]
MTFLKAMVGDGQRWSLRWLAMVGDVVYSFGLWLWSQVMDLWAEFDCNGGGYRFRWSGGFTTSFLDLSFVEGFGFCCYGFG